jgi:hypothetical protein
VVEVLMFCGGLVLGALAWVIHEMRDKEGKEQP